MHLSFVRSVSMDKWKDVELEKMKVGGNQRAREFFEDQPDWQENQTIQQRYNSKAAALYRDKILTLAQGKTWSEESSKARDYSSSNVGMGSQHSSSSMQHSRSMNSMQSSAYQGGNGGGGGYQDGGDGGYQQFNTQEFKDQKEEFFSRRQMENNSRPEYVMRLMLANGVILSPLLLICSHLPPSQGGKYAGFGFSRDPPPKSQSQEFFDTTLSSLASVRINSCLFTAEPHTLFYHPTGLELVLLNSNEGGRDGKGEGCRLWKLGFAKGTEN